MVRIFQKEVRYYRSLELLLLLLLQASITKFVTQSLRALIFQSWNVQKISTRLVSKRAMCYSNLLCETNIMTYGYG